MLQTRSAKRTAAAAVKIAVDMVEDGLISKDEALLRVEPAHVEQLLRDQFDENARAGAQRLAKGLNASPGAAAGRAVFDADEAVAWSKRGERVILVRVETSPDDFHGMAVARRHRDRARRCDVPCGRSGAANRQALRRGLRVLVVDPAAKSARTVDRARSSFVRAIGSASTARRAKSSWARSRQRRPASRTSPSLRRFSAGRTSSVACRFGPTRTSPRKPRRRGATVRRASACAAPSTCSAKVTGLRSCAPRFWSRTMRRAPSRSGPPAISSTRTSAAAIEAFDAAMTNSSSCSATISKASSAPWTGCPSSSASSIRRCTNSCRISKSSSRK